MSLRLTTWNVNGIRNPFGYQPWRDKRTFEAMFDILDADIVVFQETKIQRKDLRDDMVLVPGWDCYWSLPKHKKGYSGVVIYTRNATCAPIRAEEGITGVLCPPNSSTSFKDLPENENIGGYPNSDQLALSNVDPVTLDSEGRCVILEFPAFVLFGIYSPAMRDESRDDFRLGFLDLLDSRIRNLVAQGKRVVLTGDLNISRDERDHPNAEESMRKHGLAGEEFVSTSSRRLFNQLLLDGKVFGARDEGREKPIMWDICRGFHPNRKGMFTCWETKINARPGNYGSRIDYVVCSSDMKDWFSDSNIQEGLMGSDHCPVYAIFKDTVQLDGGAKRILDIMNPPGMFKDGKRIREWTPKNLLPTSGKLIPEFDRRKSIRDMFSRKSSLSKSQSTEFTALEMSAESFPGPLDVSSSGNISMFESTSSTKTSQETGEEFMAPSDVAGGERSTSTKRLQRSETSTPPAKRAKLLSEKSAATKGQQSLKGFFKPKSAPTKSLDGAGDNASRELDIEDEIEQKTSANLPRAKSTGLETRTSPRPLRMNGTPRIESSTTTNPAKTATTTNVDENLDAEVFIDPIVTKESWSRLFNKPSAPRCESHNEPCISYLTKKPGINCGRSFWLCSRPLGPSGNKEKGTQWRCPTFIWASDWNGTGTGAGGA